MPVRPKPVMTSSSIQRIPCSPGQLPELVQVLGRRVEHADAEDRLGDHGGDRVGADRLIRCSVAATQASVPSACLHSGYVCPIGHSKQYGAGAKCTPCIGIPGGRRTSSESARREDARASRGAPSATARACVQPWYAKSREMTFGRPVTVFAIRSASSTASEPGRREADAAGPVVGAEEVFDDELRGAGAVVGRPALPDEAVAPERLDDRAARCARSGARRSRTAARS